MIRTNAAANMLGVSASTLRSWERRYSFPMPQRSEGGHRQYELEQIEALRQALEETHNASSAISLARNRGSAPPSCARLAEAFAAFDEQLADRQLEESLALRSVERTIEEVLLPAVSSQCEAERATAAFEFGWRHATGWLSAHKRLASPASRADGLLILDPWTPLNVETLHAQALELVLRRAGLRTLSLSPATDRGRLGRAIRALEPRAVVLCGRAPLDDVARLIYAVRSISGRVTVFDFRGAVPDTGASTVVRLGDSATAARERLLEALDATRASAAGSARPFRTSA
ncbi:MAG TPA: MerR family transcriptional regulator [Solirubrobacteraceae bacterium]|jgi:DNA-binding transcriptional MerR regulator